MRHKDFWKNNTSLHAKPSLQFPHHSESPLDFGQSFQWRGTVILLLPSLAFLFWLLQESSCNEQNLSFYKVPAPSSGDFPPPQPLGLQILCQMICHLVKAHLKSRLGKLVPSGLQPAHYCRVLPFEWKTIQNNDS